MSKVLRLKLKLYIFFKVIYIFSLSQYIYIFSDATKVFADATVIFSGPKSTVFRNNKHYSMHSGISCKIATFSPPPQLLLDKQYISTERSSVHYFTITNWLHSCYILIHSVIHVFIHSFIHSFMHNAFMLYAIQYVVSYFNRLRYERDHMTVYL